MLYWGVNLEYKVLCLGVVVDFDPQECEVLSIDFMGV